MPGDKVKHYLDDNNIKYITIKHSPAYTAQQVAEVAHVPGKEMAKTVMINIDGKMAMAVLPASYHIDFKLLEDASGAIRVSIADEDEFKDKFPDCELGAMPPFGNLYGMDVYVAQSLAEDEEIFFNAGTHSELIRLSCEDFKKLVKPKILKFSDAH